ncbi:MAG: DUF488 domain-containing protein [Anaerolineae bacterium]|jgi:uncharacterized protein (DUF488 family)|nr:DUF488 domain-containing protein [Anaerolineae bacterium]
MPEILTIGYETKPLSVFITQLREAGVDAIIDIRLRNTSHLAGYTKLDTLAFMLPEGFQIAYEHHPELAPTEAILEAYRTKRSRDWTTYEREFLPLLVARDAVSVGRDLLARYRAPCLLCKEATADRCHRRLVAEFLANQLPDITVIHL